MSILRKFTEHPASVGETYGQHFMAAMSFSGGLFRAAFCCALHAVFPFLCERTGSKAVTDLHDRMTVNRQRQGQRAPAEAAG